MFFFYGTLRHAPLLRAVLGRDPGPLEPARLDGHEVRWIAGQNVPMIQPGPGEAQGLLFEPQPGDAERLDAYELGFAYGTRRHSVSAATGRVEAEIYFPDEGAFTPGPPFELQDWVADWGPMAVSAAAEFIGRFAAGEPLDRLEGFFSAMQARGWARELARAGAPTELRTPGNPIEITRQREGFDGFFRLRHFDLRHRRFDGSWTEPFTREVFAGFDAALVLPYDPAQDTVLLIEQLRLAVALRGDPHPMTLEPIAGMIEAGETPETCARREAVEEAGLDIGALHLIGRVYPSPGYSTEFHHCYLGIADLTGADKRIGGAEGEHEDIRAHVLPLDAALDLVASGEVNVAPLAMMLLWAARHRDRFRSSA
ncbi:NUDIX domain-containing protein [Roseisalinus antarcticus]|uniref:ADP-ribose pyrophosphatase n=1 Tax=Roseisalinus antarcticus TaxID=254357 RepID=A0A1Y5TWT0_9RHOB|nr:NUDIX domain-containing protein [Roseisalinus antarcticus]SLN71871.1 ADP-ribose pyrophosphatase [Roseisalinus antarcticus]